MFTKEIGILMISKTKHDDSFPLYQFLIKSFCAPSRLDRKKTVAEFFFISEAI